MATVDQMYEPVTVSDGDDIGSNRSSNRPLLEIARARMSRRTALKGFITTAAIGALGGTLTSRVALAASSIGFESLAQTITEDMQVAPGYSAKVLIRWGDPVLPGAPAFDPMNQTAAARPSSSATTTTSSATSRCRAAPTAPSTACSGSIFEYTSQALMFPGWTKVEAAEAARQAAADEARQAALAAGKDAATADQEAAAAAEDADTAGAIEDASLAAQTPEQTAIEMMAHGGGVIEVIKENGQWRVVPDSQYARRITAETEMEIAGPAAGHDLLKTSADPTGTKVLGMLNNCAGGKTPGAPG